MTLAMPRSNNLSARTGSLTVGADEHSGCGDLFDQGRPQAVVAGDDSPSAQLRRRLAPSGFDRSVQRRHRSGLADGAEMPQRVAVEAQDENAVCAAQIAGGVRCALRIMSGAAFSFSLQRSPAVSKRPRRWLCDGLMP